MTIQVFPQTKRYYDSLCMLSHVPCCSIKFPILLFPCPGVASDFPLLHLQAAASALLKKPGKRKGGEKKEKVPKKKKQT